MFRGINLRKIAEQMGGSSGAEVKGTCTEAGEQTKIINKQTNSDTVGENLASLHPVQTIQFFIFD